MVLIIFASGPSILLKYEIGNPATMEMSIFFLDTILSNTPLMLSKNTVTMLRFDCKNNIIRQAYNFINIICNP